MGTDIEAFNVPRQKMKNEILRGNRNFLLRSQKEIDLYNGKNLRGDLQILNYPYPKQLIPLIFKKYKLHLVL